MKRKIKFRFWSNDQKKFVDPQKFVIWMGSLYQVEESTECTFLTFPQESVIIAGQYTGLKDRTGREIYEGDILQWLDVYNEPPHQHKKRGIVEWKADGRNGFGFTLKVKASWGEHITPLTAFKEDIEIIGNIYENPELLK